MIGEITGISEVTRQILFTNDQYPNETVIELGIAFGQEQLNKLKEAGKEEQYGDRWKDAIREAESGDPTVLAIYIGAEALMEGHHSDWETNYRIRLALGELSDKLKRLSP